MRLSDIGMDLPLASVVLWQLLAEREPDQNISHKCMPTAEQHCDFVRSKPHAAWYLVLRDDLVPVGAVYLSKQREIGVGVLKAHRGHGYGKHAVQMLMAEHPGKFLANINPRNCASARLFHQLGFVHVQNTFALEPRA